ncbi:39S ribosomal protein L22, mitochondrial-like [Asterias rubens]|uniref:39S ribosomal protein L22, mitochondrial-like n=1 Tax=Asterias rubens TaxID=7604 RepID=UPI001455717B|nr:39S ribosomal protein L22, mitochondrial-like [Asterias rubens]
MASLRCLKNLHAGGKVTLQAVKFGLENVRTLRTSSACGVERLVGRIQSFHPGLVRLSAVPPIGGCVESNHSLVTNNSILRSSISLERQQRCLHTSAYAMSRKWERNNRKLYPPQKPGDPPRMAEVYYSRQQIKHSMRKMWYIATFVKGMMIDDALNQLQFINKKGAGIVREILLEAQEEAVKNHNVEFKSNLHIAQSFVGKGEYDHAMRVHAKGRFSILNLVYCHYFVVLKEGPPPTKIETTGYDQAQHYIDALRKRTVIHSL